MAVIQISKEELAHQLAVGGITNQDCISSEYGANHKLVITVRLEMTCSRLKAAFNFWGMKVLGIDDKNNQFIWQDGTRYGCSTFSLHIVDGVLRAKYGSCVFTLLLVDGVLKVNPRDGD